MKNFLKYAFCLLFITAAAACSSGSDDDGGNNGPDTPDQPDQPVQSIVGSWKLTAWSLDSNKLIEAGDLQVYLECAKDNTFTLYQLTGSDAEFRKLTGSYSINGKTLSGTYQDGSKWANDYTIKELNKTTMKWEYGGGTSMTYTAGAIPQDVVKNAKALPVHAVRGAVDQEELIVIL